jgi:hypothetical protein
VGSSSSQALHCGPRLCGVPSGLKARHLPARYRRSISLPQSRQALSYGLSIGDLDYRIRAGLIAHATFTSAVFETSGRLEAGPKVAYRSGSFWRGLAFGSGGSGGGTELSLSGFTLSLLIFSRRGVTTSLRLATMR